MDLKVHRLVNEEDAEKGGSEVFLHVPNKVAEVSPDSRLLTSTDNTSNYPPPLSCLHNDLVKSVHTPD